MSGVYGTWCGCPGLTVTSVGGCIWYFETMGLLFRSSGSIGIGAISIGGKNRGKWVLREAHGTSV